MMMRASRRRSHGSDSPVVYVIGPIFYAATKIYEFMAPHINALKQVSEQISRLPLCNCTPIGLVK